MCNGNCKCKGQIKTGDKISYHFNGNIVVFLFQKEGLYYFTDIQSYYDGRIKDNIEFGSKNLFKKVEVAKVLKDPVSLMKALIDGGYKPDRFGNWWKGGIGDIPFMASYWSYCELNVDTIPKDCKIREEWVKEIFI